ncbi:MAG: hypothetical protein K2W82_10395 [Candidatus Obscuribacterales bacterium]|nr:hypothetical protein [Candidatus Obscuribacterales bacterium]
MRKLILSTLLLGSFVLSSPGSFALQENGEIEVDVNTADQHWRDDNQPIPGGVTHGTESVIVTEIDKLLGAALDKDPATQTYDKAVTHYRKKSQRAKAAAADSVNAIVPYTGFSHSSEAGDIILGEKLKLQSRAAAEYAKQKNVDEKHHKLNNAVMHIATGLGGTDPKQVADVTAAGIKRLQELVGEVPANEMFETLKKWSQEFHVSDAVFAQKVWTPDEQEEKLQIVVSKAVETDKVINSIDKQVHKYNHMSKGKRVAGKVVRSTLGAACLTPTVIGPAAQIGLTAFELCTGGPEESKLLKELYLMKRRESRTKVLSEQAHLALSNYQLAVLTKNPIQLALSELMIADLAGSELAAQIITTPVLDSTKNFITPTAALSAMPKVNLLPNAENNSTRVVNQ